MLIKIGSRGDDVVEVQTLLKSHGYKVSTDGIFGKNTATATKAFQKENGLVDDGIVGNKTYEKLKDNDTPEPQHSGTPWLKFARGEIGVHEVYNESRVHYYWKTAKLSGLTKYPATDIPWCSALICAMTELSGIRSARTDGAKNWLNWGVELKEPCDGCIVVFTRKGGGHVGIVVGEDEKGNLLVLGGNQGNAVNVKSFSRSRVTGYRYPEGYTPSKVLSKGNGTEVSDNEA